MRSISRSLLAAGVLGTLTALAPRAAQAAPCADLDLPNPIYGTGGSAITETLKRVGTALRNQDITILYADPSACTGYDYFVAGSAASASYKYWSAAGVQSTCEAPEVAPQFAHMGNPVEECEGRTLPDDVGDFGGPIQTLNVITDIDSEYNSISAEALYFVYKFGATAGGVEPWVTDAHVIKRSPTSFVHLLLAEAIDVPAAAFFGTAANPSTNQQTVTDVVTIGATSPNTPIGYVSGSAADAAKAQVKTLAYQHYGQECAYWPDSSNGAQDRLNVRTGLYQLWTPGHFFAKKDASGNIADPAVAELVGWITGTLDSPGDLDVTRKVIEAGDVPQCAMRATREGLLGAISSYAPPKPCECYFEAIATTDVPDYCDACADDSECGSERPKCNYGFCELYRVE